MKMIYDVADIRKLEKILDRQDLYMTCAVEGDAVAVCLKQQLNDGTERICDHAMFHIPKEQ